MRWTRNELLHSESAHEVADHESTESRSDLRFETIKFYGGVDEWFKSAVY